MPNQYRTSLFNSSILFLIVLTAVGYAGNYFSYPFGFGVDFLFGSIAILIIVSLYGIWWGAFSSLITSTYTIILWQHPYALIIFICEALFVGWRTRQGDRQLLTSDMIFWIFIGMPLVLLFYGYILKVGTITTLIILLKQPVNGIFNALIASLILNYPPIHRWSNSSKKATVFFKQLLLDLLVAFVLIPALILMVINNEVAMNHEQDKLIATLETSAQNLANDLQRWHQFGLSALRYLAQSSSQSQIVVSGQTQYVLNLITESFPLFREAYIINADLQVIAASQTESTSKLINFSRITLPREPQIFILPNSIEGDSANEMPKILQTLPIILDDRWLGNIIAELNIEFIEKLLETETHSVPMVSTLLDQKELSIATTNRELGTKKLFSRQDGEISNVASPDFQSEIFHWLPIAEGKPLIARWRESFYIQDSLIDEEIPLILSMEAPAAPYIDYLQLLYIRNLAILLAIALVSIAIARYLSRLLIEPILNLAIFTTDLPDKILRNQIIKLPRSPIIEMNALANNFEVMSRTVEDNIQQIRLTNQKLKLAKEKSEVANRAKDQFLANISHELKTPLNTIIGYSRLIHKNLSFDRPHPDNLDNHKFLEWLEHVQQNGKYLLTLIDEILDLAKSKANKIRLHPSLVNVASFTEDIVLVGRRKAAQKNLSFRFETSQNLPGDIYTDEQRLRQILLNLIDNAVKFTEQGRITLQISRINADTSNLINKIESSAVADSSSSSSLPSLVGLRFKVIDTGIGIDRRDITRIFQPFEQVDKYEFSEVGTGLGLSISSQLVELMGSKLKVKTQLDKGSIFWFDLAFPEIKVTPIVEPQLVREIVGYKGEQLTILIVDDVRTSRLLLQDILEPLGFKILTAKNGQQGLQLARQNKPDLILTDIFMPIKTGFTLIAELRQDDDFAQTPIIAVSASSFEEIDRQSRAAGCNSFIAKPVDDRKLLNLLGRYLNIEWIYQYNKNLNDLDVGQKIEDL